MTFVRLSRISARDVWNDLSLPGSVNQENLPGVYRDMALLSTELGMAGTQGWSTGIAVMGILREDESERVYYDPLEFVPDPDESLLPSCVWERDSPPLVEPYAPPVTPFPAWSRPSGNLMRRIHLPNPKYAESLGISIHPPGRICRLRCITRTFYKGRPLSQRVTIESYRVTPQGRLVNLVTEKVRRVILEENEKTIQRRRERRRRRSLYQLTDWPIYHASPVVEKGAFGVITRTTWETEDLPRGALRLDPRLLGPHPIDTDRDGARCIDPEDIWAMCS